MTDQEIKNSITEKALKYGVPSKYSELFDNLTEEFKINFNESISERKFGYPIVRYGHSNGNWVIIGTKELAIKKDKIEFIPIEQISSIDVPTSEREKAEQNQSNRMIRKFEYEILTITTFNSEHINVWLNKKQDYYGFWHMMRRFFGWRNDDNTNYS